MEHIDLDRGIRTSRRKALRSIGLLGIAGLSGLPYTSLLASEKAVLGSGLKTQPYLQNPEATAMTIAWLSLSNSLSWVEYGETAALGKKVYEKAFGMAVANNRNNKVRVTGLRPGTKYFYRVCTREVLRFEASDKQFGMMVSSPVYTFSTPSDAQESVTALVFNDIHENASSFKTLLDFNNEPFDFVFLNGDIISEFEDQNRAINCVINPCSENFARKIPFFFGRGNHETRGEHSFNFFDYFETPGNKTYFSFSWGPVFFITLDSGEDKADSDDAAYGGLAFYDEFRIEQAAWLEKQLKSADRKQALYTVVFMHIPSYHSGNWHGPTHVASRFGPLFNEYGISVLISGHTHSYHYCPGCEGHHYPIMIGGAPNVGKRTLIKLTADRESLRVVMYSDSGMILNQMNVQPAKY